MSRSMMREPQRFPFTRLRPIASSIACSFLSSASAVSCDSISMTLLTNQVLASPSGSLSYSEEARTTRVPGSCPTFSIASTVLALRSPRFDPMPMCTRCGMPQGAAAPWSTQRPCPVTLRGRISWAFSLSSVERSTIDGVLTDSYAFYKPNRRRGDQWGRDLEVGLIDEAGSGRWSEQRRGVLAPAEVALEERHDVAQRRGMRFRLRERRRRVAVRTRKAGVRERVVPGVLDLDQQLGLLRGGIRRARQRIVDDTVGVAEHDQRRHVEAGAPGRGRRHRHRGRDARIGGGHQERRQAAERVARHGDARAVDQAEERRRWIRARGEDLVEDEPHVRRTLEERGHLRRGAATVR